MINFYLMLIFQAMNVSPRNRQVCFRDLKIEVDMCTFRSGLVVASEDVARKLITVLKLLLVP